MASVKRYRFGRINPHWLERAAKRKFGRRIEVVGSYGHEIDSFLEDYNLRALQFDQQRPQAVGRQVVDINTKELENIGDTENTVKIRSPKAKLEPKYKEYLLTTGSLRNLGFSGRINVGPGFFNLAAGPSIGADLGRSELTRSRNDESLSQDYGFEEEVQVKPKCKLTATITTWAVTYESSLSVEFSMPSCAILPVKYRTVLEQCCCGLCSTTGYLTPADFFQGEQNYRREDGWIFFTMDSKLSYLGETTEVVKRETPIQYLH